MTLLMFICTVSCFRLMANTTSVSHGAPCWPVAFPFLPRDGVDVLVTESRRRGAEAEDVGVSSGQAEDVTRHRRRGGGGKLDAGCSRRVLLMLICVDSGHLIRGVLAS